MKPGTMDVIGDELALYAEHLVDVSETCEPNPQFLMALAIRAHDAVEEIAGIRTYAAHLVCQFVDSAVARVLGDFPEACKDVATEILRDAEGDAPAHDHLSDNEKAALQLAHAVLCFVTRIGGTLPPREKVEDAQG